MKKFTTPALVVFVMIIAILGITNPGRKDYRMFDHVEGKLMNNYFIFSTYQQYPGYTLSEDGKYRIHRRFIGLAMNFYEIKPLKVKQE